MRRSVASGMYEADTECGINSRLLSPVCMKNADLCLVVIHRWTHIEEIRYSGHPLIWCREFNHTDHSQEPRREEAKRSSNSDDVLVTTSLKMAPGNVWEKPLGGGSRLYECLTETQCSWPYFSEFQEQMTWAEFEVHGRQACSRDRGHWKSHPRIWWPTSSPWTQNLTHWGLVQNLKWGNTYWMCVRLSNEWKRLLHSIVGCFKKDEYFSSKMVTWNWTFWLRRVTDLWGARTEFDSSAESTSKLSRPAIKIFITKE